MALGGAPAWPAPPTFQPHATRTRHLVVPHADVGPDVVVGDNLLLALRLEKQTERPEWEGGSGGASSGSLSDLPPSPATCRLLSGQRLGGSPQPAGTKFWKPWEARALPASRQESGGGPPSSPLALREPSCRARPAQPSGARPFAAQACFDSWFCQPRTVFSGEQTPLPRALCTLINGCARRPLRPGPSVPGSAQTPAFWVRLEGLLPPSVSSDGAGCFHPQLELETMTLKLNYL